MNKNYRIQELIDISNGNMDNDIYFHFVSNNKILDNDEIYKCLKYLSDGKKNLNPYENSKKTIDILLNYKLDDVNNYVSNSREITYLTFIRFLKFCGLKISGNVKNIMSEEEYNKIKDQYKSIDKTKNKKLPTYEEINKQKARLPTYEEINKQNVQLPTYEEINKRNVQLPTYEEIDINDIICVKNNLIRKIMDVINKMLETGEKINDEEIDEVNCLLLKYNEDRTVMKLSKYLIKELSIKTSINTLLYILSMIDVNYINKNEKIKKISDYVYDNDLLDGLINLLR